MAWLRWVAFALVVADGGYMVVDGVRALAKGDYFTPKSGEQAGQLGPWARLVTAIGGNPRSTAMKLLFVVYGTVWLGVAVAFALGQQWSWLAMMILAVGSIWYLVPGTFISVAAIAILLVPSVHDLYS